MTLRLSAAELSRLEAASRVLLSPLEYADLTEWRTAANTACRELLQTERASFFLRCDGGPAVVSDFAAEDLGLYSTYQRELESKYERTPRAVALGVYGVRGLYREHLDEYLRGPLYNDFLVPRRTYPRAGMAVATGEGTAELLLHHPAAPSVDQERRDLAVVRLAFAAFEAGVRAAARIGRHRARLTEMVDVLTEAILVCGRDGGTVHANAALSRLLAGDPEGERIAAAASAFVRSMVAAETAPGSVRRAPGQIRTATALYRLRGSYVAEADWCPGARVLITVERVDAGAPSPDLIRQRFGLTRREAEVALLLAARKSNDEIARALCVSPHTARHHTEHVMLKLGISSRRSVSAALLTGGADVTR